jgi:hypothetical protein
MNYNMNNFFNEITSVNNKTINFKKTTKNRNTDIIIID